MLAKSRKRTLKVTGVPITAVAVLIAGFVTPQAAVAIDADQYNGMLSNITTSGVDYLFDEAPPQDAPDGAADGGRLLKNTNARVSIGFDIAIPDNVEAGDQIALSTNTDNWSWTSFPDLTLSTADGIDVATARAVTADGSSSLLIEMSEAVERLGDITAHFEGSLTGVPDRGEHRWNVPVELFSPDGMELIGGGHAYNIGMNSVNNTNAGVSMFYGSDGHLVARVITQFRDVREPIRQIDRESIRFTAEAITEGVVPVCEPGRMNSGQITWILDDGLLLVDPLGQFADLSCEDGVIIATIGDDVHIPTASEVREALGADSDRTGTIVSGVRVTTSFVLDTPGKQYDFHASSHGRAEGGDRPILGRERVVGSTSASVSGTADGTPLPSNVEFTKTVVKNTVDEIVYEVTATNTSEFITAYGVIILDLVDEGVTFVEASGGGEHEDGLTSWPSTDIAPGKSVTYRVVFARDAGNTGPVFSYIGGDGENICRSECADEFIIPEASEDDSQEDSDGELEPGSSTDSDGDASDNSDADVVDEGEPEDSVETGSGSSTGTDTGALASTGSSTTPILVGVGLMLILAGAATVFAVRRNRRAEMLTAANARDVEHY